MTAHTPAEWIVQGSEVSTAIWVLDNPTGKRICTLAPNEHDLDRARLLAAAPDLLAALIEAEAWLNALLNAAPHGNTKQVEEYRKRVSTFAKAAGVTVIGTVAAQNARAAIAKARGNQGDGQ